MAPGGSRLAALFAVTVRAPRPEGCDMLGEGILVASQVRAQRRAAAGEQAGVQGAVGGDPRTMAVTAERGADRTDGPDLAAAVQEGMAPGDFTAVGRVQRAKRPPRVDAI